MVPQIGKIDNIVENVDGLGTNITFQFRMFSDKSYEKPYLEYEYPVDVSVKQRLYFEASVSNINGDKFVLSIRDIVASVDLNVDDKPNYFFVKSG